MSPMNLRGIYRTRMAGVVSAIAVIALCSRANAAALSWNNAGGGAAATSTNWTPNQVPGGADDLTFNLNASYTVSYNATANASRTHTYRDGTVTLSITSPHTASTGLTVGDLNLDDATMTLTTGSFTSNGAAIVGDASGSIGRINVNDDDADLIIGSGADLTIGNSGDGTLSITGTGHVQVADQFIVGSNASSTSTVTVSGFSVAPIGVSLLEAQGANSSRIGAGGDATLFVQNGGVADFAADLIIANGSASTSSVTVEDQGLLDSALRVDGDLLVGRNISDGITAGTGTLNLNIGGQATVQGDTFLGDPDGGTGTLAMGGGTFNGTLPVNMELGSAITGFGTINADVNVGPGSIVTTTAAGITMEGIINNAGSGVFGTKIHFGATGGYTGSGSCAVEITGHASAQITATGTLSLGKNTISGFSYGGGLDVGGQAVTLLDSNGAVFGAGSLTTMSSAGSLTCTNGIGVSNSARIQGEGTLVGNVTCAGILDPQDSGPVGGTMQLNGNLVMNPTGIFDMEIGGTPASNEYDRLNVSGTANFGGTLRVTIPNGFVPKVGQQFIAVNATAGRIGEFDSIIPPSPIPCNEVTFVLVYSSTAAIVLVRPPLGCTALGDLNSDGGCNGMDIQLMVDAILSGSYVSCADLNGDCVNSELDVPIFVNCAL